MGHKPPPPPFLTDDDVMLAYELKEATAFDVESSTEHQTEYARRHEAATALYDKLSRIRSYQKLYGNKVKP